MKHLLGKARLASRIAAGSFFIVTVLASSHVLARDAATQRIKQLEQNLQTIQIELEKIKSESAQAAQKVNSIEQTTNQTVQQVNTIQQSNSVMEARIAPVIERVDQKSHMLFFRGGFTHAMQDRNGVTLQSNVAPVGAQDVADKNGFYVGAGLDWNLTNDVWGAAPGTSVFAELMFEYKEFGNRVQGNALANSPTQLAGGALNPRNVTVSQFTLSAAPKIKFLEGSKIRPWIIPAGLAIHVISPPSESITVLTPGVMFGAGVDYNIWKDFYVGIDGRYNLTAGKADGVRVDGMTAGAYAGIGF
ncbi:MAG: outer membrane beta-barrel protein [Nitrosomonas sp.]|nr:outer membrane beta-barrel protein [Nitrosomonas sp.]MDP1951154.1 outer membrane beta-barrel protein [Nitrosomonas sp.]